MSPLGWVVEAFAAIGLGIAVGLRVKLVRERRAREVRARERRGAHRDG